MYLYRLQIIEGYYNKKILITLTRFMGTGKLMRRLYDTSLLTES
jgi:hypothetical protein